MGGTCGNVAVILAELGLSPTILAQVGSDFRGASLIASLRQGGVDVSNVLRVDGHATGAVVEIVSPDMRDGHRFLFRCPSCGVGLRHSNMVKRAAVRELNDRIDDFGIFFFDRARRSTIELAEKAAERDSLVVFEPYRPPLGSMYERAAATSHVVKYARRSPRVPPSGWVPPANWRGRLIIETLAQDGLRFMLRDPDQNWLPWRYQAAIQPAAVCDTAGAGDWCTAGVIHDLARAREFDRWSLDNVEKAITFGQALAAVNVAFPGPRGALHFMNGLKIAQLARTAVSGSGLSLSDTVGALAHWAASSVGHFLDRCTLCLSPRSDDIRSDSGASSRV